jgi:hypothetical protein
MTQNLQAELARCDREIADAQSGIARDEGALIGSADWHNERRILQKELRTGNLFASPIVVAVEDACESLSKLPLDEQVQTLNEIRTMIHKAGPFANEPVDLVLWVALDKVEANDYNPNSVAPPEMKLLERSIDADGYTQPIVSWPRDGVYEVVDGFHRNRVGAFTAIFRSQ